MALHGGVFAVCPAGGGLRGDAAAGDGPAPGAGFRHLFGPPKPEERALRRWTDPMTGRAKLDDLRPLMAGLARLMDAANDDGSSEDPDRAAPSPEPEHRIPAGYTYLFQFIAHDLVQTSTPFWALPGALSDARNTRTSRLRLDALYGGGPGTCPFAYAPDDPRDSTRTKLRLGRIGGAPADARPYLDIARAAAPDANGAALPGLPEPMLADPRNDDNTNLSQLTVLLAGLHNAVVDLLPPPQRGAGQTEFLRRSHERFACARDATTLVWRRVVREDALAKLLHPTVHVHYGAKTRGFDCDDADAAIPLEFSHGAFRFGHAMVRNAYRINARSRQPLTGVMTRTSDMLPGAMPLSPAWIVAWGNYFDLNPATPAANRARRLRPRLSSGLLYEAMFPAIDDRGAVGLGYRDLVSACAAGMRSVASLYAKVPAAVRDAAESRLADGAFRRRALAAWFGRNPGLSGLSAEAVAALAEDPPLPFYVLFEAGCDARGLHLGLLGSVVVAEVLFGALARDPLMPWERPGEPPDTPAALRALAGALAGDADRLRPLAEIRDVPGLIRFVGAR